MNTKLAIFAVLLVGFLASVLIDTRFVPVIGAAALIVAIYYDLARNRSDDGNSYEKAERATARQKRDHTGARSE